MRHKSKQWITVILFAAFISSALPAYASDSNAYKLSEYLEPAETITEIADTIEIASTPNADEPIDSDLTTNAETIVGNSSLELIDSDTSTSLSELELYTRDYKYIDVLINGDYANNSDYSCVSSDENIVQVDNYPSYFKVQGISAGIASITVVTNDGAERTLNVTVKAAALGFVEEYDDDILTSLIVGTDYNSSINVDIQRLGSSGYADEYSCTSSDESVAKVYENDYCWTIEGISVGTATITATNQYGESGTLSVTVKESGSSGYLYKDAQGNVLEYAIYDNEISIAGYTTAKGAITIPSQIDGLNVTTIESHAFAGCTSITKVTINSGIKHIDYSSFASCSGLKSVELPDSIEDIGSSAFSFCSGLSSFRIPPNVTRIEDGTFCYCNNLSSVTIPNGVTYIGNDAFSWCKLASINLPNSLEEIGFDAFSGNPIKTIKIPANVKSLDVYAISNIDTLESIQVDANNKYYSSKNGILFNKSQTEIIRYPAARANLYYEIPAGVTDISPDSFSHANNLMSVTIPGSVTYIGSKAFNSEALNYLYVLGNKAPVATADAIANDYYRTQKTIIAVPSGASGYNEAPWSKCIVKKQGTVRPTSAAFSGTEFTVPTYSDEPYLKVAVLPSNAVCKEVIYKIGNEEVNSFSAGTFYTGASGNYTLTAITKDGHATAKVKLIVKQNTKYFSDMWDIKHPFYKPIYWAAQHGITNGYSDGTFGVNRNCTRGECVMFLWKMMGKPAVKAVSKSPFKDVPQNHAFYKAILWASQNGITKGYSDGTFGINRNCTRGEIMMFIWRAKDKPAPKTVSKSPFKDVSSTNAFYKAILWGSQKGVTKGYSDGTFGINRNCTRGEIVTFLYRVNAL